MTEGRVHKWNGWRQRGGVGNEHIIWVVMVDVIVVRTAVEQKAEW